MVLVRYEELVVRIAHDGSAYAGARACRAHRVEAEAGGRDADEAPQQHLKLVGREEAGTIWVHSMSQCDASAVRRITEGVLSTDLPYTASPPRVDSFLAQSAYLRGDECE